MLLPNLEPVQMWYHDKRMANRFYCIEGDKKSTIRWKAATDWQAKTGRSCMEYKGPEVDDWDNHYATCSLCNKDLVNRR